MTKFPLGSIYATPGALSSVPPDVGAEALLRHSRCDWGEICDDDRAENDRALKEGRRLLSAYRVRDDGQKFWIITEADRSVTTVLLPEEY